MANRLVVKCGLNSTTISLSHIEPTIFDNWSPLSSQLCWKPGNYLPSPLIKPSCENTVANLCRDDPESSEGGDGIEI